MKKLFIAFACITALAVLLNVPSASAQGKLEGVWKLAEINVSSPQAQTIKATAPSLITFTKKHYSVLLLSAETRPDLPQQGATDAQKLAAWAPFESYAGTYEIKGTTFTGRNILAKNPFAMKAGDFLTCDFSVVGDTLIITPKVTSTGPVANPPKYKMVRVE